ncbi:MAG: polyphenol oxidase family protein [Calditrichia bacterium]
MNKTQLNMQIRELQYPLFDKFPQVSCSSIWIPEEQYSPTLPQQQAHEIFYQILAQRGMPENKVVMCPQVHGNRIAHFQPSEALPPECDGIFTEETEVPLVIRTADCAAIMIFSARQQIIANVHAGWRGVYQNVIENALEAIITTEKIKPSEIYVAISPFLRSCCYRVTEDFLSYFSGDYITQKENTYFFDLEGAILERLLNFRIPMENIEMRQECTYCSPLKLPSYRRTKTTNRILSIIQLTGG